MTRQQTHAETLTIRDYVQVVRRRRLTILAAVLTCLLAGVALTLAEKPRYSASSKVLIGIGKPPRNANQRVAPDRLNATQAGLAASSTVATRVLEEAGVKDRTPQQFLADSSVNSNPENDILTFSVSDESPDRARLMAAEYARQFILARRTIDKGSYVRQVGDAFAVGSPTPAVQTGPDAVRNIVLAWALGLLAGILAAFIREGLDTRVRSAREIVAGLGLPLLGRLPKPSRSLLAAIPYFRGRSSRDRVAMLTEPNGRQAELYRILRSNVDFFNMEHCARSIMVTSARWNEGKSTTAANLAVAFARTGRRVILVDADLRRPSMHAFFEIDNTKGLTETAAGEVDADRALVAIELDAPVAVPGSNGRKGDKHPQLRVLPAGEIPTSIGEFVASPELAAVLESLKDQADLVIVDGPPLLGTGDGVALASKVDALALVAHVDEVRQEDMDELTRVLDTCRAKELGVILTGASLEQGDSRMIDTVPESGQPTPEDIALPLTERAG